MIILEQLLGWLANLIQVATFAFTLFVLWRARQRLRTYLQQAEHKSSEKPVALAVGIGNDIEANVAQYLESAQLSMPLQGYCRSGFVPKEQYYSLLRDLLKIKQELLKIGATEVHLFYMGPVTLALGLGSIFDNWVPVKIYEFRQGKYELVYILEKGTVLGLVDEIITEGEAAVIERAIS